jgi:hypothetical protein
MFAKTRTLASALLLLSGAASPAFGPAFADDKWSLGGYAKSYLVYQEAPDATLDGMALGQDYWQSQNALRLMLAGDVAENVELELHYEIRPQVWFDDEARRNTPGDALAPGLSTYRYDDLDPEIRSDPDTLVTHNLDRLNFRFSLDPGDLTIGRQTISFGSARFVSPTDIFQPFGPGALDTEYRSGVDAIRWLGTLGDLSEYDIGVVANKGGVPGGVVTYARIRASLRGNDLEATVIHRDGMVILGGGWERALGLFGFWSEIAHTFSEAEYPQVAPVGPAIDYPSDYTRFSIGLDRALTQNIFAMAEYHHSSFGTDDPAQYQNFTLTEGFRSGGIYLVGQDYLMPSLSWTVTPLLGLGASAFVNLSDSSAFLRVSGEFSISDNLYTDFGVFFGVGEATKIETLVVPQIIRGSEFGAVATKAWVSLRYYF